MSCGPLGRCGALALIVLVLHTACATGRSAQGALIGAGHEGEQVTVKLPVVFQPVEVSEAEFANAVAQLVLAMPLRVSQAPAPPSLPHDVSFVSGQLPAQKWRAVDSKVQGTL
jgi:hypothetical protein